MTREQLEDYPNIVAEIADLQDYLHTVVGDTVQDGMTHTKIYTISKLLTFNGKTQTVAEWSQETGIPYHVIYQRIFILGWAAERALTEPAILGKNQFSKAGDAHA